MKAESHGVPRAKPKSSSRARGDTRQTLLTAAEHCLREEGYTELSTRKVAEQAGVPLSQIHYHFGSKEGLLIALLEHINARLLGRQAETFAEPQSLSRRWERACDHLDADLNSGFVRILQELMAAGWSDPDIAAAVRASLGGWFTLLRDLATEAAHRFGGLHPFTAEEIAALVGAAFLGVEAIILLGMEDALIPARQALRRFGDIIRLAEERSASHD